MTQEQVDIARDKGFKLFVCNNAIDLAPDADLLYAINHAWWAHYYPTVKDLPCEKWSGNIECSTSFPNVNYIHAVEGEGLSAHPQRFIHHGHGSGYSLVGMAHRAGAERIVLLGYDLKYAPDYDGKTHRVGSGPRHFFGEYPSTMQHWPKDPKSVQHGVHVGLVELYRSIAKMTHPRPMFINCTPDSAIDCFPRRRIENVER